MHTVRERHLVLNGPHTMMFCWILGHLIKDQLLSLS
jgi:hypothetical protein